MEINLKNCPISGGVLNNSVFGDNNHYVNGNEYNASFNNIETAVLDCLDEVAINSDSRKERKYAIKAKKIYNQNGMVGLKKFFTDNLSSFTTGTFATVSGGLLYDFIKGLLK